MPTFAAIDIGSNSVRLSIAELHSGRLTLLHQDREVTRLGEGVFRNGTLNPQAMAHTIKVIERFRRAIRKYSTDQVRMVATSAMRDAKNSHVFTDWLHTATGWKLEVITGLEEGRLIHLGVISKARVRTPRVLLIDLGGGSCELTLSVKGHIREMVSLPLGAVRLTQDFLRHDPPLPQELRRMRSFIGEELERAAPPFQNSHAAQAIATSGTAAALAAASGEGIRASMVSATKVARLAEKLSTLDKNERKDIPGINSRRAEIIVAGSAVFAELMRLYRLQSFRYSPMGLRDGILAQMAADFDARSRSHKQMESDREDAVKALCSRYQVDAVHAEQVRRLAGLLFGSLRSIHQLPAEYGELIGTAAMLYEAGAYVNHTGRHRHAYYLIANSEIFGYTPVQRQRVAAIARYQGNSRAVETDAIMRNFSNQERTEIIKAVCILRVARALNQGRHNAVRNISTRITGRNVQVNLRAARAGADLEIWTAEKEVPYFREVFGRELLLKLS